MHQSNLDAALEYAWHGWHVFPVHGITADGACTCRLGAGCLQMGKHPACERGLSEATDDEGQIDAWWADMPYASIGVAMAPSGLVALDIDKYHGDMDKLAALEKIHGELPATVLQLSGSGEGYHALFRHPGHRVRGIIGGIVVRANAYIIVAPSKHKSGNSYQWQPGQSPGEIELAALPEAWRAAMEKTAEVGAVGVPDESAEPEWLRAIPQEQRVARMRAHLEAESGEVKGVSLAGTTYNVMRTAARGYAVRDPEAVLAAAMEIYDVKCVPPWEERIGRHVWTAYSKAHTPEWGDSLDPGHVRNRVELTGEQRAVALFGEGILERAKEERKADRAANAPMADQLKSDLDGTQKKLRRKAGPLKYEGELIGKVLNCWPLTDVPADRDKVAALAIAAIARHAPRNATDEQLATILQGNIGHTSHADLAAAVAAARQGDPFLDFGGPQGPIDELPEPADDDELRGQLYQDKAGGVSSTGANIARILRYSRELRGHLRFNDMTREVEMTCPRFADAAAGTLDTAVKNWLRTHWQLEANTVEVGQQMLYVAVSCFAYNPVREYLRGLTWDGVPRVDTWLQVYCGADDTEFNRRVAANFLIGACARGIAEISKVDTVLVLEGEQGAEKSTCLAVLASDAWFCDTPIILGDKDAYAVAASNWIVELAELASMSGREVEAQKAFLSAKSDKYRPPYGRAPVQFNRHCVFAGTTNEWEYLQDASGARRWWPVRVGSVDTARLAADRDQLWAEAVARYLSASLRPELAHPRAPGERWWFTASEDRHFESVTAARRVEDPWVGKLRDWGRRAIAPGPGAKPPQDRWTLEEIALQALQIPFIDLHRYSKQLSRALRVAGFEHSSTAGENSRLWQLRGE